MPAKRITSSRNSILLLYSFCEKKRNRKSVQRFAEMMDKLQKNELKLSKQGILQEKTLDFFLTPAIMKSNDAGFASKMFEKVTNPKQDIKKDRR